MLLAGEAYRAGAGDECLLLREYLLQLPDEFVVQPRQEFDLLAHGGDEKA